MNEARNAGERLSRHLFDMFRPGHVSVGVAGEELIIYLHSKDPLVSKEAKRIELEGWDGCKVKVRYVGKVRPA